MTVWRDVIGQESAVATLHRAATDPGAMTHAWLLTGPPGSGRSVAARAFAAALECPSGGCGECIECRTAVDGSHADVDVIATEGLSIKVEQARDLAALSAHRPSVGRSQGQGRAPSRRTAHETDRARPHARGGAAMAARSRAPARQDGRIVSGWVGQALLRPSP